MKKLIFCIQMFLISTALSAELTEKQMKDVSRKIVQEALLSSKLEGEYKQVLKHHLERVMYSKQILSTLTKIAAENAVSTSSDAELLGFNVMTVLREKSILTLSNNDLYDLMNLNIALLAKMSDYECAQYVKKKRTDEGGLGRGIHELTGQLSISDFKKYIGYYDKAFQNLFIGKSDSERLSDSDAEIVSGEFQSLKRDLLTKDEFVRSFFASGKSFSASPDSDVCRVSKELIKLVVTGDREKAKKRASAFVNGQL